MYSLIHSYYVEPLQVDEAQNFTNVIMEILFVIPKGRSCDHYKFSILISLQPNFSK